MWARSGLTPSRRRHHRRLASRASSFRRLAVPGLQCRDQSVCGSSLPSLVLFGESTDARHVNLPRGIFPGVSRLSFCLSDQKVEKKEKKGRAVQNNLEPLAANQAAVVVVYVNPFFVSLPRRRKSRCSERGREGGERKGKFGSPLHLTQPWWVDRRPHTLIFPLPVRTLRATSCLAEDHGRPTDDEEEEERGEEKER